MHKFLGVIYLTHNIAQYKIKLFVCVCKILLNPPVFLHESYCNDDEDGHSDGDGVVDLTHGRRDDHRNQEEQDEGVPKL